MTSELSNALNPHGIQTRSRQSENSYSNLQPVVQRPQQYVPHRSELELAISEPPPPPPRPRNQSAHAVQELLRILSTTREAQEIERKRRLAWEQELEAKYAQRQAEMERQMFEMRQEIAALRAFISVHPSMANGNKLIPELNAPSHIVEQQSPQPLPSSTLASLPSSLPQQNFVQGCSTHLPSNQQSSYFPELDNNPSPDVMIVDPPSLTISPSPRFASVGDPLSRPGTASSSSNRRKRQTPRLSSGEDTSDTESSSSPARRPVKRVNHHDGRCLTIQHAMRSHIMRAMQAETDKGLPDSHIEGAPLGVSEPVRFVWEKTPKQSVHNARMKARILADLKANRRLYKHVPDKEFGKKILESAFDQAFTTFRQKFKAQRDASTAVTRKRKEDHKAMRARRLMRKKTKLANRSDTRNRIEAFEHVTFDGALQMDCMSSEESDAEDDSLSGCLRIRGFAWRSTRLQNFFDAIDEEDKLDKALKPKRGVGRKERFAGPLKDGFPLPPKGIANWMVSRRWINTMRVEHPELLELVKDLVTDPPGFDWNQYHGLGDESEDEADTNIQNFNDLQGAQRHYMPQHDTITTSSLHYALAHVS